MGESDEAVHGALNSHIPPSANHFAPTNRFPFQRPHFFPTCHMGDQSESTSFHALFDSAFQAYEEKTGITLADHPLAIQLQSCHSVESMTALVLDQISAFNEFRGKDRLMKLVTSILSILTMLSAAIPPHATFGLVCRKSPDDMFH